MSEDLRYPIGQFDKNFDASLSARTERIEVIKSLPARMGEAAGGLDDSQLDTEYRLGGWTVRQTVHHVADSHANSLIRFKLALTEDEPPTIRPYYEDRWAELADCALPIDISLTMLSAIHARWYELLRTMSDADFQKSFIHPETGRWALDAALALYAWHSEHHTAHITRLRSRLGW